MDFRLSREIDSESLSREFSLTHIGNNKVIHSIGHPNSVSPNGIFWAKSFSNLVKIKNGTIVCKESDFQKLDSNFNTTYLIAENPRLTFCKIMSKYYEPNPIIDFENDVETHRKNKTLTIGENVFIAKGVKIGNYTVIHHHVSIYTNTKIGEYCTLQANVSVGTEGLGLELDPKTDLYIKFPQLGGVILEDHVELGPGTTIRRAALENTLIGRGSKIGALCNIGHNTIIGTNCIFTCNVITSGSSKIGNRVFMGVSSVLKQGISIGNNATIGQGAVVVKNVPDNETWVGNPAKSIG